MNKINQLKNTLETPQRIVIVMHERPDGDALGSSLALAGICRKKGHEVTVISPTVYPKFLAWLPGIEQVIIGEKCAPEQLLAIVEEANVIICLDFGEYKRLGEMQDLIRKAQGKKIVIDHHLKQENFASITLCNPKAPATAFMLYQLLLEMKMETLVDKEIATALYVGILTDTGSFSYRNTTVETHRVVADLLEKGVDVGWVHYCLEKNTRLKRLQFIAHAITHRLFVFTKHGFAYLAIPSEDFKKFGLQPGDTGGLVQYALSIRGIDIAVLATEQRGKNQVRLSFRSFGDFSVNDFAQEHFQGGGHKNAAGGIFYGSLVKAVKKIEEQLKRALKE